VPELSADSFALPAAPVTLYGVPWPHRVVASTESIAVGRVIPARGGIRPQLRVMQQRRGAFQPGAPPCRPKGVNGKDLDRIQRTELGLQIDVFDGEIRLLLRR